MQTYFNTLAQYISDLLQPEETSTCWLSAEDSHFVRFNRSRIRQPGHVRQSTLSLQLIRGHTHARFSMSLSGQLEQDQSLINDALLYLREQFSDLPEDPHLMLPAREENSYTILTANLPSPDVMVQDILEAAQDVDMVGFLMTGAQYRGFASSNGQRNWYETNNVNFDWSLFHSGDKAVKANYAGVEWDSARFRQQFQQAIHQLAILARPPISIPPGNYRAYLTPTALNELIMMLNWGGLSEKALRTSHSSLRKLRHGDISLHPAVHLTEDSSSGLTPAFQEQGLIKPGQIPLIAAGKLVGSMVSPRSAREYGIPSNGASDDESANAIRMQAGNLPMQQALKELGTGVYISNLWYLNFSDRANCRITGMTRFASFWVENGEIQAPLNVMRFDDSLFKILGDHLLALTAETEIIMDDRSYGERHTGGAILPGALLKELRFVL
ncbi:TldD/PmbA family protein [Undibacterium sp. SXout7W]|uniref:TldD/PmbA family protein n=1 Tax=Undibacterium sp. SXout7W TaxID=3413049 RepID=UPI003BF24F04